MTGKEKAQTLFAGKTRVRVCGLLVENASILMVQLDSPTRPDPFWSPPGGGLKTGETLTDALKREFLEETGLTVEPSALAYISEFIEPPWHAVELYFWCTRSEGASSEIIRKGADPELPANAQIIKGLGWLALEKLNSHPIVPEFLKNRLEADHRSGADNPVWIR